MALQVWLPLNGNLDNQGLNNNITITNKNATVDNHGKIGKCYKNTADGNCISLDGYMTTLKTYQKYSMCAWVYISGFSTGHSASILSSGNWNNSDGNLCFALSSKVSNGYNAILIPVRGNWNNSISAGQTLTIGNWYHICVTYDSSVTKLYINGQYKGSKTIGGICSVSNSNNLYIGAATYTTGFTLKGSLNDVRIYDHCLSPKEVKEISKALVVHYTLDDNYQEMNNCFSYPTFNTSTGTGGWNHWHPSGSSTSYSQNTNKEYIYNKNNTYSHKFANTKGNYSICYQSPAFSGGYRSAQAIIKIEGGGVPNPSKLHWSSNSTTLSTPTTFTPLGDGFYLMKREGFKQSGSDDLVSILSSGVTVYISEAYLENDRQFCSNIIGKNTTVVYDSSGFGNNGVITGNLISEKDTPRYNKCLFFDGSSYITTPSNQLVWSNFEQLTICAWMKPTSTPTNYIGSIGIAHDGSYTSKMFAISNYGGHFYINITNGSSYINYNSGYTCPLNEWHYYSATLNNTTVNMYVDGQLIKTLTISFGSATVNSVPRIQVGVDLPGTDEKYIGYYSDIRIYATALSEKDILELYNTSVTIDNNGNMFSYKFHEENLSQQKILKTGLVKIDNFIEFDNRFKILSDGSVFLQILHHNNPASNLFTKQNCWFNNDPNLFSNLVVLKNCPILNNLDTYEFLGIEKQTSSSTEKQVHWTQTSNPALSSTIVGYTLISGAWYNPSGNGLRLDNTTYSAMHNSNVWWGACGCYTPYQGGIPGYSVVVTSGYLDLYIRIPEEILNGNFEGFLKFFKKSILSTQLLEI